jgi:hypothetical protein
MSPVKTLLLSIGFGVAGALAVVIFQSVAADAVGGAMAIAALVAVTWSVFQLAGEPGPPDDQPL